jgi:hypothetical protein
MPATHHQYQLIVNVGGRGASISIVHRTYKRPGVQASAEILSARHMLPVEIEPSLDRFADPELREIRRAVVTHLQEESNSVI